MKRYYRHLFDRGKVGSDKVGSRVYAVGGLRSVSVIVSHESDTALT